MDSKTPVEIIIELNREKREEEMDTKKHIYGEGCPHTVTDENLGTVFCIKCGIVTEEQTFTQGGGGPYVFRKAHTPRRKGSKKK